MTAPLSAKVDEVYQQYPDLIRQLAVLVRPLLDMPLPEMAAVNERMQTLAPESIKT